MKQKKINCTAYFKEPNSTELIAKFCFLNPYTGMIDIKFTGLMPKHIDFLYENKQYNFNLYSLGGKYFMNDFENSSFNRIFQLDLLLAEKKEPLYSKIKI